MAKWNDKQSMSFSFNMEQNEEARVFFERTAKEFKKIVGVIKKLMKD